MTPGIVRTEVTLGACIVLEDRESPFLACSPARQVLRCPAVRGGTLRTEVE